jgi:hypothetical protein
MTGDEKHELDVEASQTTNELLEAILRKLDKLDKLDAIETKLDRVLGKPIMSVGGLCSICLDPFVAKYPHKVAILHCKHVFHEPCWLKWGRRSFSCPLCRLSSPFYTRRRFDCGRPKWLPEWWP